MDQPAAADLIHCRETIADGQNHAGLRWLKRFPLPVAMQGMLSGWRSSRDLETSTLRQREQLNEALGHTFRNWLSDAASLNL